MGFGSSNDAKHRCGFVGGLGVDSPSFKDRNLLIVKNFFKFFEADCGVYIPADEREGGYECFFCWFAGWGGRSVELRMLMVMLESLVELWIRLRIVETDIGEDVLSRDALLKLTFK